MDLTEFRWTDRNRAKLAEHGITREEAEEEVLSDAWVPYTHDDYPEQTRIVGPTDSGRFITLVLAPTGTPGVWRPVTGWEATDDEREYYWEEWP